HIHVVSSSSIVAKVMRDKYMKHIASKYPIYKFDKNKGYGSKEHIEAIKKFGHCEIHRTSFKLSHLY
ncbi:MAG: ribonuclease HII, partial [Brevinematia bacterium]